MYHDRAGVFANFYGTVRASIVRDDDLCFAVVQGKPDGLDPFNNLQEISFFIQAGQYKRYSIHIHHCFAPNFLNE